MSDMSKRLIIAASDEEFGTWSTALQFLYGEPIHGLCDEYFKDEDELVILCSAEHTLCDNPIEDQIASRLDRYVRIQSRTPASYSAKGFIETPDGSRGSGSEVPSRRSAIFSPSAPESNRQPMDHRGHTIRWSGFLGFCFDCRIEAWAGTGILGTPDHYETARDFLGYIG